MILDLCQYPHHGPLKGVLLAFALGENGKPIDLNLTRFRRSKKNLRKRQNSTPKEKEEKEEKLTVEEDTESLEVYVQGMPYETTEEDVRSFFAECGDIQEVRLSQYIQFLFVRCSYHDSGKCRGYGFVRFSSPEEVKLALQKDKEHMGTRYVNVSLPHKREATVPNKDVVVPLDCKSIFVKNLPYEADEDSVKGVFMRFGKISSVRIPRHMDTGRQKGICYVEYLNGQSVKQAVAMSGILEMQGRKLTIDVETGKPKNSFRSSDGRLWSHVQKRSGSQVNRGKKQKQE